MKKEIIDSINERTNERIKWSKQEHNLRFLIEGQKITPFEFHAHQTQNLKPPPIFFHQVHLLIHES